MTPVAILTAALCADIGIVVETPDPRGLKQKLYKARRENPTAFSSLSFLTSRTNPEGEIWIAKNKDTSSA